MSDAAQAMCLLGLPETATSADITTAAVTKQAADLVTAQAAVNEGRTIDLAISKLSDDENAYRLAKRLDDAAQGRVRRHRSPEDRRRRR